MYTKLLLGLTVVFFASNSRAADDPVVLMGQYLAAVAGHEAVRREVCPRIPVLWNPTYDKSEAWVVRLLSPRDQADFPASQAAIRAESKKSANEFITMHGKFKSKLSSDERACTYVLGFIHGLASPTLKRLYTIELQRFGKVTPQF